MTLLGAVTITCNINNNLSFSWLEYLLYILSELREYTCIHFYAFWWCVVMVKYTKLTYPELLLNFGLEKYNVSFNLFYNIRYYLNCNLMWLKIIFFFFFWFYRKLISGRTQLWVMREEDLEIALKVCFENVYIHKTILWLCIFVF